MNKLCHLIFIQNLIAEWNGKQLKYYFILFCPFEILHLNSYDNIYDFIRKNNGIHNQNDLS